MGALKGTLSYTTYYVGNEPGDGFREILIQELERHRHREIDVEAGRDQSLGWVVMGAPWSREFTWEATAKATAKAYGEAVERYLGA